MIHQPYLDNNFLENHDCYNHVNRSNDYNENSNDKNYKFGDSTCYSNNEEAKNYTNDPNMFLNNYNNFINNNNKITTNAHYSNSVNLNINNYLNNNSNHMMSNNFNTNPDSYCDDFLTNTNEKESFPNKLDKPNKQHIFTKNIIPSNNNLDYLESQKTDNTYSSMNICKLICSKSGSM